ncbi:hypothetical protein KP509_18G023500 [Ceratopteris richardii]|uniref:Uncharacterized protein n=1 Tax=Ceratopteris richardii TaxID=49495 RepID=A0A8T2SQ74_CERRI|nr:hypothetical protein KP509_18G023500 [Ceratopteris richardii]
MVAGRGSRVTGHGSRVTGHGSRVTGHGSRATGHGSRVTGHGSRVTGHRSQVTGHRSQVTGHRSQVTGHRSQVTGHRSQVTGHRSQVTGHRSQVTGHRSQVTGHRSQVTGHRSQVTGHRSQVIETPRYMQTYLPHHLRIERGRAKRVPKEERWCPKSHIEIESEEHLITRCLAYSNLRVQFQIKESLQMCMTTGDQRRMGLFISTTYERREKILWLTHQTRMDTQETISYFFQ